MKSGNLVTQSLRQSDSGQCWEEKMSGAQGSIELPKCTAFRVRATGATTVTVDGVLAMTMSSGEIAVFNTGDGNPDATKSTVTVTVGGANAFLQVARETYRVSLTR